jgi:hypothetical protein
VTFLNHDNKTSHADTKNCLLACAREYVSLLPLVQACFLGHLNTGFCVKLVLRICFGKLPVQLPPELCDFLSVLDNFEKVNSSFHTEMFHWWHWNNSTYIADMAISPVVYVLTNWEEHLLLLLQIFKLIWIKLNLIIVGEFASQTNAEVHKSLPTRCVG